MKIKFNNIDINVLINIFNKKYCGLRLNNIYEINSKNIILKLADKTKKVFIKLVSGFRFHTIKNKPDNCRKVPTSFCSKFRKHVKNKRLISIKQLGKYGFDRIIDFQFGER